MILRTDQKFSIGITAVRDAAGNEAQLDGVPVWSSSDESLATVAPVGPAARKAYVTAVGPTGAVTISVSGDADLGEGVVPIVGYVDVQVVAGQAVAFELEVFPAEPKDTAPPTP